jgi:hypothetical protein
MNEDQNAHAEPAESAPDPHQQANIDAEAAIKAIEAEWSPDDAPVEEAAAAPAEAPPPAAEPPAEEPPAPEDRSLSRLVEREVEIRRREDAVKASEERVTALQQELESLREAAKSYSGDFHEQLRLRPGEALKAAGHDPDHVVRLYLAEKLTSEGKPVPPELRTAIKEAEYEYKLRTQEHRLTEYQRQQEAAQWAYGIEMGARTYLTQEFSKHAPTLASVAKANPDYALRTLMDEIAADVHSRKGKDLSATVLTYEEAAKRAEQKLAAHRKLFVQDPPSAGTTAPPGAQATTPASKATVKSSSPTAPKPLVAEKSLTQKELEEQAIAAGIAEFRRSEKRA